MDNSAFLWQPAPTLAKTTAYDPASPINALTKVDGVAQTHDVRGNRTGAAGRTWRYDTRNMLTGANAPGMAATYGYYPEGGRAWKQVNGVTTLYLEVGGVEWGSYDPNGTLKERTIRASGTGGAVVAVHAPTGGLIRLLPNRQGSVIGWLRPDGKLGGAYTYDAYGNSAQAGAAGPQFRYAGMRYDAETGLYHTPFRAYDPQDGRWMQLDPAGLVDGLNRYAYVRNSPLMGVDPTGLADINFFGKTDPLFQAAEDFNMQGYFIIAAHGNADAILDNRIAGIKYEDKVINPDSLAEIAKENGLKSGQVILLMECQTGSADYAQKLSNLTGSTVLAPKGYGLTSATHPDPAKSYSTGKPIPFSSNETEDQSGPASVINIFDPGQKNPAGTIEKLVYSPAEGKLWIEMERRGSRIKEREIVCVDDTKCKR